LRVSPGVNAAARFLKSLQFTSSIAISPALRWASSLSSSPATAGSSPGSPSEGGGFTQDHGGRGVSSPSCTNGKALLGGLSYQGCRCQSSTYTDAASWPVVTLDVVHHRPHRLLYVAAAPPTASAVVACFRCCSRHCSTCADDLNTTVTRHFHFRLHQFLHHQLLPLLPNSSRHYPVV
jgi:hypothetical protein